VLTFEWLSDHELRCPLFPTLWATTATLFTGRTYRVVGTVSFRDRTLAIRVLGIRESVRRHAGDAYEEHAAGDRVPVRLVDGGTSVT
jgi:hypothetical protein